MESQEFFLLSNYTIELQRNIEKLKLLYFQDEENGFDSILYNKIFLMENRTKGFILDFDSSTVNNKSKKREEEILCKIVELSRKFLCASTGFDNNTSSLETLCIYLTNIVKTICDRFGIENYPIDFVNGISNHTALLLKLFSGNYYVIDLTYQQFFLTGTNLRERHVTRKSGLVEGPYVGFYMIKNGFSTTARHIIEKGYISVEEPGFKQYMDGFINSFYYDKEKDLYLKYNTSNYIDDIKVGKSIGL